MGSVWLAERVDGRFDRRVAVKFLSVALAGRGEERFRREGASSRASAIRTSRSSSTPASRRSISRI